MNIRTLALAAALSTVSVTAFATAPSVEVKYADLDLTTPQGMAELDNRIDAAARRVCGLDDVVTGTKLPSSAAKRCYEQARQKVKEQVAAIVESKRRG